MRPGSKVCILDVGILQYHFFYCQKSLDNVPVPAFDKCAFVCVCVTAASVARPDVWREVGPCMGPK